MNNVIISKDIEVDTSLFQLAVCQLTDNKKVRYCIIHKKLYGDSKNYLWTDEDNHKISLITKEVYDDIKNVLLGAMNKLNEKDKEINNMKELLESKNILIEGLRKNGVID